MISKIRLNLVMLVVITLVSFPLYAHAYLDPATGSYMLQVLLATAVGAIFALKRYWGRIKDAVRSGVAKYRKG